MPAPDEFPLLPRDRRFYERLDRVRTRDPPPYPPPTYAAPYSAYRLLWAMIWRSGPPGRVTWRPAALTRAFRRPQPSSRVSRGVTVLIAAGLLPVGIIFCLVCRPDLPGRRLRARQVTPRDVRRVLWHRDLSPAAVLVRFRL